MPLPLLLGIVAAAAAAGGIGGTAHGAVKMKKAKDTSKAANARHQKNEARFEKCNKNTSHTMDVLGNMELDILSSFQSFSDLFEKIQNRPSFKEFGCESVDLPEYDKEELSRVSVAASTLMAGLSGAALGTAGGFAAAGATTSAVMALGTASTGTSLSTLSGAALTKATLAALGGGAKAVGGGGIALGTTVLGVTAAGAAILVGGIIFSVSGSKMANKADMAYNEMLEAENKINRVCDYLNELKQVATKYIKTLNTVDLLYKRHFNALDAIININKKTDWNAFTPQEKLITKNTILLVQLLYKMCQVKLVNVTKKEDELNTVNKADVESTIKQANILIKECDLEIEENASTEVWLFDEHETQNLAKFALLYYFAKCDDSVSEDEENLIHLYSLVNDDEVSKEFFQEIDEIKACSSFDFKQLRKYIDKAKKDFLEDFSCIIDQVIQASEGITDAEKQAKEEFDTYLKARK